MFERFLGLVRNMVSEISSRFPNHGDIRVFLMGLGILDHSGTLMVKDKSHRAHQDFFHTVSQLTPEQLAAIPDHYQFTRDQLPYWEQFDTVRLQGRAGSLFLWDSRTTHSVKHQALPCLSYNHCIRRV